MSNEETTPARFLVRVPDGTTAEFEDPTLAGEEARRLANVHPNEFIGVYALHGAVRYKPETLQ